MQVDDYDFYLIRLEKKVFKKWISVIIPAYNAEKTISKTLDSFENQDFSKELFEVIVIDDWSTDKTKYIIENYIKRWNFSLLYYYIKNAWAWTARNLWIEKSKYEIFAFTDADCIPDNNWLSTIYKYIEKEKNIFIGWEVYTDNNVIFPWKNAPVNQIWITASMAINRSFIFPKYDFWLIFKWMLWDDTNFVLSMKKIWINMIFIKDLKIFHPVNILTFHRLMLRTRWRQNEVLLYKQHWKEVLSSFNYIFRPLIFWRLSLFFVLFIFSLILLTYILLTYWFIKLLYILIVIFILFELYLYKFLVVYTPDKKLKVSYKDRTKTFFYLIFILPLYIYYRIKWSIKFRYLMI